MEQTTNSDEKLSADELRAAGASGAFIAYYNAAKEMGEETRAVAFVEEYVPDSESFALSGFLASLWDDEPRFSGSNPYGADGQNKMILEAAGVYDVSA